ncbi:MAG: efflux RND transporter permease subunit [Phycisphaeraceae bacterium]|nr:efflux RND transporter permease subunit [Phycisphaeraceae bacterium]
MKKPTAFESAARQGRFTDLFVRKPVVAIVINIAILAIGWRAISVLPVRQYPRLESSSIVITTVYIGASAETVRGFITTPIERAVSAIDGIDYIESSSTAGVSVVTVRLRLNHPSVNALAEISARLNQVRSELPPEAESPVVDIVRTDKPYATFYISFTSDTLSLTQINEFLVREVQPVFQTIPGVQRVGIEGARPLAMRIWLDAARMDALDITPLEVQSALTRNNFVAAVGRAKAPDVQIDLLTDTDLRDPAEFEALIVRERDGTIVRLRDIARIELGSEEPTAQTGYRGKPSIYLSVWPLPRANELDVSAALKRRMAEVAPSLPPSIRMDLAYDGTYYMENAIREIGRTLVETISIVAIVVFIFLGSVRTVLVPLVAIPISLTGACIFMWLMGFSLNLLTILAIVLAVGLVVDDAIVMVENVARHVREGLQPVTAALTAGRELASPIVAMTLTLAVVYTPIGFQGGLTGMLFREFAFTLAAAVVVSGLVALTLSPIMSAALVGSGREGRMTSLVNRGFDRVRRVYGALLDWTLELRWTMAAAAVLIAIAALPLYMLSGSELAPTEDEGFIISVVQSAPDATLEYTLRGFDDVNAIFAEIPERDSNFSVSQVTGGFGGVKMRDWRERQRTTGDILPEVFMGFSGITGIRAIPVRPPPLPGAGQFDVELMVTSSEDADRMAQFAPALIGAAFASGKFIYADGDLKIDLPQLRIEIDRQKVADMGLDLASVGRELAILLAGGYVNRFNHNGRSYKVIPQVADSERATPEQLLQLKVRTASGGLVPLSSFVTLRTEAAPRALTRFQQRNSMKIYGVVVPGTTKAEALAVLEEAARAVLPPGYTLDYAGESRQIRQEGSSLTVTLGFALLLIYLVLAAQFGSFRDPLIVLLGSVPLAISGSLIFAFLDLTTINIYSQVGLITLVGLVAKNGILIVEFANQLQERGLDKISAVRESAQTRLRPILMTSAATVFGHFPLVIVTGAGAAARNSIGIMLVSGMAISTLFTLFVVPSIYALVAAKRSPATDDATELRPAPDRNEAVPASGPLSVA